MERMKDLEEMLRELSEKYKNSKSVEVYEEDLEGWFKIIDDLREENKKLNEEIQRFKDNAMQDMREITELGIENKKLKAELSKYKKQYQHSMGFMEEDTLQELRDIGEI